MSMTVTNPDLSPTGSAVQRQLLVSISAHAILGYSLYFVAVMQTAPPVWAVNIIEQLKPTLGALDTAARLSQHPFPAQVMILYAVLSSLLLGMYWVYYMFFVNHIIGQESYRGVCERLQQTGFTVKDRLAVGFVGVAILSMFGYELPISFFVEGGIGIGITSTIG
jgi:hypothetical protein